MTRKIMKKVKRWTKIDEEKLEFENENTHDLENPDSENANSDRWIFVDRDCFSRVVLNKV